MRIYNDCQAVEQALRQQLVEAIDPTFLDALRNPYTYMVQSSIPAIMRHLQQSYGFLTDEELSDKEDALKSYIYDPVKTVDDVFNKITKQQELCILMNSPMPDKQQVSIAYKIFNRAHISQNALIQWNNKDENDKTATNMKVLMRDSWNELNKVGASKVKDSSLNVANLIQ